MSIRPESRSAIVISASSDIGAALCLRWRKAGMKVCGTYRSESTALEVLRQSGVRLFHCDLEEPGSVDCACAEIVKDCESWDALVLCPGDLEPVGPFCECDFDAWERSLKINFTAQLRIVRALLPTRRRDSRAPLVLFFAGGGTNGATANYSAYTVSKIALMKICELLDAEMPDTRFSILGPGWVRTKIHEATLKAGQRAGDNFERTVMRLKTADFVPMERVLDCCDWIANSPREVVSGRNFSAANDDWGSEELSRRLRRDSSIYKLRRAGNDSKSGLIG